MKVIIVGCGKFGSGLAMTLEKKGNEVTIIDNDPEAFELLDKKFMSANVLKTSIIPIEAPSLFFFHHSIQKQTK